uniref:reverse transcriptase N-terminal domain-containing protein n=1 Tax=Priestia megaterium TaxID=1404 RepID=UPI001649FA97
SIIEKYVAKLGQRIYGAEEENEERKVRKVEGLVVGSKGNVVVWIGRVREENNGKGRGGVDGYRG